MNDKARARLIHLLILKSMAEALLVTAIAVGFYFATTNPNLRGVLDKADASSVTGWAVDESNSATHVEIQLFIDDVFVADGMANQYRPDVHNAKRADDDWHGFIFHTPQLIAGDHQARVYAVHVNGGRSRRTLQLIGKPYKFHVD
ncbi:MAG TPA: hypothetical protein VE863_11735 [Pyrinomonadaceae bacterium]|nr:hypothetical protein [Pyrinomonadaceae bacterium]